MNNEAMDKAILSGFEKEAILWRFLCEILTMLLAGGWPRVLDLVLVIRTVVSSTVRMKPLNLLYYFENIEPDLFCDDVRTKRDWRGE